jgi:NitT/TauT family transport system permease protein
VSASRWAWPVGAIVLVLAVWEAAVAVLRVKVVVLPPPSAVAAVVLDRWPLLLEHLWPTLYQIVLGFALSVAGGLVVAVLLVYSEPIRKGVLPLIVTSQIVPKVAVAPLLVVWFGTGDLSRLLLAFLIAFFPIVINTVVGLTSVDDDYIRMARAFMGTRWHIFAKIRLPHALPLIFGGMKISITLAVIGIVVAEFVAAQRGIGYLIVMANGLLDTPLMMAAIAVLSGMGLALYGLIAALERVVVYWHVPAETTAGGIP